VSDEMEPGHGHSPAAWTAVIIMLVGFALGTLFFFLDVPILVWVSAGIVVLGLIAGVVLARMGYGAYGDKYASKGH
jgi:hypothetical protein